MSIEASFYQGFKSIKAPNKAFRPIIVRKIYKFQVLHRLMPTNVFYLTKNFGLI